MEELQEEVLDIARKAAKRWADEKFVLKYKDRKEFYGKDEEFYRSHFLADIDEIVDPEDLLIQKDTAILTGFLVKMGYDVYKDSDVFDEYREKIANEAKNIAYDTLMDFAKKDLVDVWSISANLSKKKADRYQKTFKSRRSAF